MTISFALMLGDLRALLKFTDSLGDDHFSCAHHRVLSMSTNHGLTWSTPEEISGISECRKYKQNGYVFLFPIENEVIAPSDGSLIFFSSTRAGRPNMKSRLFLSNLLPLVGWPAANLLFDSRARLG